MKLYALTLSPFAARVRLALRLKGLAYEQEAPPGGSTRSTEYLAINPIGKLPVLVTDDGLVLPESETIIDYLDEEFPAPSLMVDGSKARAQMRNAIRTLELYVVPALTRLFGQMDPETRNAAIVEAEIASLRKGLSLVQLFVDVDAGFVAGGKVTKADCLVLPTLLLVGIASRMFGQEGLLGEYSGLSTYITKARQHPDMGAVWNETEEALQAMTG